MKEKKLFHSIHSFRAKTNELDWAGFTMGVVSSILRRGANQVQSWEAQFRIRGTALSSASKVCLWGYGQEKDKRSEAQ